MGVILTFEYNSKYVDALLYFAMYPVGLFGDLEGSNGGKMRYESLGIESYGISMTTLEEVFLRLGKYFAS